MSPNTPREELAEWNDLTMPAFARPILLPIPTICAIGGHAFGAGFMFALAHDFRMQQSERGFLCAIEVAIGVKTPPPELTLFRYSMSASSFYETVLHAKRWGGQDAYRAGIVQASPPAAELLQAAVGIAGQHAKLGANRSVMGYTKKQAKGHVAREILVYIFPGGKQQSHGHSLPEGLANHVKSVAEEGSYDTAWSSRL